VVTTENGVQTKQVGLIHEKTAPRAIEATAIKKWGTAEGRSTVQALSHQYLPAEAQVQSQGSPRRTCEQRDRGADFFPSVIVPATVITYHKGQVPQACTRRQYQGTQSHTNIVTVLE